MSDLGLDGFVRERDKRVSDVVHPGERLQSELQNRLDRREINLDLTEEPAVSVGALSSGAS